MAKFTFLIGAAAGYVLGARAGRERYEQIKLVSGKVWNSKPVQRQLFNAKEAARTKAAPAVADLVADAARATGEKLRASKTVPSAVITDAADTMNAPAPHPAAAEAMSATGANAADPFTPSTPRRHTA